MQMCGFHIMYTPLSPYHNSKTAIFSALTSECTLELSQRPVNRGVWCHASSTTLTLCCCDSTGPDRLAKDQLLGTRGRFTGKDRTG
jgi:hypothetical protein